MPSSRMGKNKKRTAGSEPQMHKVHWSTEDEKPKKKKVRPDVSHDCISSGVSLATKAVKKSTVHEMEEELIAEKERIFERKLKKERKKEEKRLKRSMEDEHPKKKNVCPDVPLDCIKVGVSLASKAVKKVAVHEMEEEMIAEKERIFERKLKKERKKEEKRLKRSMEDEHPKKKNVCPDVPLDCINTGVSPASIGLKKTAVHNAEEELTAEEMRVFERKLKKERKKEEKKLKQECPLDINTMNPEKPSGSELALQYLTSWSQKAPDWKFQKTRQTWLLLHMYNPEKVPQKHFPTLLDYLEGLKGSARDLTVRKAEALMKEHEQTEDSALLEVIERARQVIQLLS